MAQIVEECVCNARDLGSIPGLGRSPGEGNGNPFQYSCLENSHGQRSLESYSPQGHRESDKTERLSAYLLLYFLLILFPDTLSRTRFG